MRCVRLWRGNSPQTLTQTLTEDGSSLAPLQNWCCFQTCPGVLPGEATPLSSWGAALYSSHFHLPLVQFLVFRTVVVLPSVKTGNSPFISPSEVVSWMWLQPRAELPWHVNERACMRVVTEQCAHGVSMTVLACQPRACMWDICCVSNILESVGIVYVMSENTPSITVPASWPH